MKVCARAPTVRFLSKTTIQLFQCPLLLKYELQKLSKSIVPDYCRVLKHQIENLEHQKGNLIHRKTHATLVSLPAI